MKEVIHPDARRRLGQLLSYCQAHIRRYDKTFHVQTICEHLHISHTTFSRLKKGIYRTATSIGRCSATTQMPWNIRMPRCTTAC